VDQGGLNGTFVNLVKIDPHIPFPLNADDLIGVGCPERSSARQGGRETFVYRIRAPRAFQQMDTEAENIDLLDGDAPTPPPEDLENEDEELEAMVPDMVLPSPVRTTKSILQSDSLSPSRAAQPSTSNQPSSSRPSPTSVLLQRSSDVVQSSPRSVEKTPRVVARQPESVAAAAGSSAAGPKGQVQPGEDGGRGGEDSKSKSGHMLEVITVDSSDDETVDDKRDLKAIPANKAKESEVSPTNFLKRKMKSKSSSSSSITSNKKFKQIFGSDSDNESSAAIALNKSDNPPKVPVIPSPNATSEVGNGKNPDDPKRTNSSLPIPIPKDTSPLPKLNSSSLSKSKTGSSLVSNPTKNQTPFSKVVTPNKNLPVTQTASPRSISIPESPLLPKLAPPPTELAAAPRSEHKPAKDGVTTDSDLEKLAEKIKAARKERTQHAGSIPSDTLVKLEFPVTHIKKELPDSLLPAITMTGGYSQEPEVITICDSEEEEDYDAKQSQIGCSFSDGEENYNDSIKEEVSSELEFKYNDDSDDEEVQILQDSENRLFAAISKRIKVEFDESLEQDAQNFVHEVIAEGDKEQEMINMIMEAAECDADMAICAIAQAKENFNTDEPTVEQAVEVITGESWCSDGDVDDSVDKSIEESDVDNVQSPLPDTSKYKIPKVSSKASNRPSLDFSDSSLDSVDDLLEGLEDDEPSNESDKRNKLTKSPISVELKSNSSKMKLIKDLFDDDIDDDREEGSNSTSNKSNSSKSDHHIPVDEKSQSKKPCVGARLIEPMAMPKKRPKVSSTESERRSLLETLHRSKPKPAPKPFYRKIGEGGFSSKEKLVAERKQRLASLANKNKKVVSVKETNAPVGIMKMSQPKNHSLLLEMSSCSSMQPKRKPMKQKQKPAAIFRSKITEKHEDDHLASKEGLNNDLRSVAAYNDTRVENQDQVTLDEERRKKYAETSDGYMVPKKMSVSNIEYSRTELQPVTRTLSLATGSILKKKGKVNYLKKKVSWLDHNGFHSLVEVKEIPNENIGKKCNSMNNKDNYVKVQQNSQCVTKSIKKDVLMDDIFVSILNWNTAWLEEQKKMAEPPPVHHPYQLIPVTNTFSNWEEYRKIFLPLMLQELWSSITREYEEKKNAREDIVPVCLQEVCQDPKGKFLVVRCMGLLTEQEMRRDFGVEGTLVQLNIRFNLGNKTPDGKQAREIKPCFGFVQNIKRVAFRKDHTGIGEFDLDRIKQLEILAGKNKQRVGVVNNLVHYTIRVKLNLVPPDRTLSSDKPIFMKAMSRIRPELRKFEAILDLPQSSLFESIVSPKKETLQVPQVGSSLHATIQSIPAMAQLNPCQKEIIVSVSQACVLQPEVAKICLVQGPPGTGKSSTIAGLILQMLYSKMELGKPDTMPKILVVAPSNAAVDELALKLIALKSKLPEPIRFRLLRLGVQNSMHHQVRSYSFDAVVSQFISAQTRQAKATESLEKDERNKQSAANQLYAEKMKAECEGKEDLANKLARDYKEKMQQIEKIKAELRKPLDTRSRKDLERVAVDKAMSSANIILATLSSSLGGQMEKYFVQGVGTCKEAGYLKPINVCIMDEASQCVEPEALIPFKLGFSKLVMVGDHEQLPATVTSRKAQQLDYQQSLFGRLFSYFTGISGEGVGETVSPVLRLVTQYRMHEEIATWPSRYFYGGKLTYGGQDRASCLPPYTVLEVAGETRQQGGHCWNQQEQVVVMDTIHAIKALVGDKLTIGVITFYAKQKQNLNLEIQKKRISNIVVNTVDGFQGSERDIIIISCVRSGGGGIGFLQDRQRLNVALTRARYSLVVVGNMTTLSSASEMWTELVEDAQSRKMMFKLNTEKGMVNQEQLKFIMFRTKTKLQYEEHKRIHSV